MQARSANVVNYRHRVSLELLSRDLDRVLSKQQRQVITLELIEKGLMLMPWWLRLIKLFCSADKWKFVMHRVWEQHDDLLESMWRDSMTHMTRGKDRVDPKSAGGYNSEEMKIFTDLLDRVGYLPGNNLVMTALRDGFFQDSGQTTAVRLKEEFSLA